VEQGVKSSNINYCLLAGGVAEAAVAAELSLGPATGHAGGSVAGVEVAVGQFHPRRPAHAIIPHPRLAERQSIIDI